jgi:hypothetical protein
LKAVKSDAYGVRVLRGTATDRQLDPCPRQRLALQKTDYKITVTRIG